MENSINSATSNRLTLVRRHKRRNKPTFIFFLRRKLRLDAIGRLWLLLLLLLCQDERLSDSVLLLLLGGDGRLRTLNTAGAPNPSPSRLSSRQRAVDATTAGEEAGEPLVLAVVESLHELSMDPRHDSSKLCVFFVAESLRRRRRFRC
jgi:hypothetical protein